MTLAQANKDTLVDEHYPKTDLSSKTMAGAARKEVTPVPSSQEYWGRIFIQAAAGS